MASDQEYYNIWSGANLLDSLVLLITIGLMFIFLIIRILVPFTLIEAVVWSFIVETYVLGFGIIRLKMRVKHKQAVEGIKFLYIGIWRDYTYYERKLIGITQWYKVDIDWSDEMLNEVFESTHFKSIKKEIENWAKAEITHHPEMMPDDFINFQETENSPNTTELIVSDSEHRAIASVDKAVPYKYFDFADITTDLKKRLQKYNIYIGITSEPHKYSDQEVEFDRICLLTDTDIDQSLRCKPSFAVHEGYPVDIEQCECAVSQLGIILPEIPVYMLTWSENMTKKILEPALQASSINYIEMKVLEKFIYTLRAFSQQAAMAITQEQTKSNMFYDAWDDLLQEIEELNLHKELGSRGIDQLKTKEETHKLEKYRIMAYVLMAITGFLIFILIVFFASVTQPEPKSKDSASLILPVINLLKFL